MIDAPEVDRWVPVSDRLPTVPGAESEPVYVAAREFGQSWRYAVARCWISTETPLYPKFYLDREFYHTDALCQIAEQVYFWQPLPEAPDARKVRE